MKVTVEVDCTPEEGRRFLGLPDVGRVNDVYVDALAKAVKGGGGTEQMGEVLKQVAPMGQFGLKLFQQLMENGIAAAGSAGGKGGGPTRKGEA